LPSATKSSVEEYVAGYFPAPDARLSPFFTTRQADIPQDTTYEPADRADLYRMISQLALLSAADNLAAWAALQAVILDPDDPRTLYQAGLVLSEIAQASEALPFLLRARAQDTGQDLGPWLPLTLAWTYVDVGHDTEAALAATEVVARGPMNGVALNAAAMVLHQSGHTVAAQSLLDWGQRVAPDDPVIQQGLEALGGPDEAGQLPDMGSPLPLDANPEFVQAFLSCQESYYNDLANFQRPYFDEWDAIKFDYTQEQIPIGDTHDTCIHQCSQGGGDYCTVGCNLDYCESLSSLLASTGTLLVDSYTRYHKEVMGPLEGFVECAVTMVSDFHRVLSADTVAWAADQMVVLTRNHIEMPVESMADAQETTLEEMAQPVEEACRIAREEAFAAAEQAVQAEKERLEEEARLAQEKERSAQEAALPPWLRLKEGQPSQFCLDGLGCLGMTRDTFAVTIGSGPLAATFTVDTRRKALGIGVSAGWNDPTGNLVSTGVVLEGTIGVHGTSFAVKESTTAYAGGLQADVVLYRSRFVW